MVIRRMKNSDVDFAFQCTSAEGWSSETKEVFESFLAFNPDGCFIAKLDSKKIGLCVATPYRENGFIGELIVVPEARGKGYGGCLLKHSFNYLKSSGIENIYLDGDVEAVPLYEKMGFRKICQSRRYVGKIKGRDHAFVRRAHVKDMSTICKMDLELFGENRSFFLWRRQALFPELCFVLEMNHSICGYIMARPGINVISVGPMAILNPEIDSRVLLESLALNIGHNKIRIGILETNEKAVKEISAIETFEEQVPSWRMVRGPSEKLGIHDFLYAIGSAAKG